MTIQEKADKYVNGLPEDAPIDAPYGEVERAYLAGYSEASKDAVKWLKEYADSYVDCYSDKCGLINAIERKLGIEETKFED